MMPRTLRAFLMVLVLAPAAARGQSASVAARTFFQAHTDRQWLAMADCVDTSSLKAVRRVADRMISAFSTVAKPEARAKLDSAGATGVLSLMDGIQSIMGPGSMLRFEFARVKDAAELQALSDRELLGRWFEAKSVGYAIGLVSGGMMKAMLDRMPAPAGAELKSALDQAGASPIRWEVVGEIAEGDSVAHVAYRAAGLTPQASTGILTFHSSRGRWYIRFTDPVEQLGHMSALAITAMQAQRR